MLVATVYWGGAEMGWGFGNLEFVDIVGRWG